MSKVTTQVRFWGVRGSIASAPSKYGSNTSCVEVDFGNQHSLFLDAGTGIRAATANRHFSQITLFLSHFHWDHIQGIPFISALNDPRTKIRIISGYPDTKERLGHLFDERFHPVPLSEYEDQIEFTDISVGEKYPIEGIHLEIAELNHPGKSYALKLYSPQASFIYATDSDYDPIPESASKLLQACDYAIVDSQYLVGDSLLKAHYGHSSFQKAIDICAEHQVRNCYLYHYDPFYGDSELTQVEEQAQKHVKEKYKDSGPLVRMAKEGDAISIGF